VKDLLLSVGFAGYAICHERNMFAFAVSKKSKQKSYLCAKQLYILHSYIDEDLHEYIVLFVQNKFWPYALSIVVFDRTRKSRETGKLHVWDKYKDVVGI